MFGGKIDGVCSPLAGHGDLFRHAVSIMEDDGGLRCLLREASGYLDGRGLVRCMSEGDAALGFDLPLVAERHDVDFIGGVVHNQGRRTTLTQPSALRLKVSNPTAASVSGRRWVMMSSRTIFPSSSQVMSSSM